MTTDSDTCRWDALEDCERCALPVPHPVLAGLPLARACLCLHNRPALTTGARPFIPRFGWTRPVSLAAPSGVRSPADRPPAWVAER